MSNAYLSTYLNDHMAGSDAGLELIDHIVKLYARKPGAGAATALRDAIAADQKELEKLVARLEITQSPPRRAAAWISEKFAELKLRVEDLQDGPFRRFELWEAMSLGIEGKRLLWRALATTLTGRPEVGEFDFGKLEARAEDQRKEVEAMRLKEAEAAFGTGSSPEA